jgi:hypothetical protein
MSQPTYELPAPPPGSDGPWSPADDTEPPVSVGPAARPRRNRLVIALTAMAAVLLVGAGVLTTLLLDVHAAVAVLAAAERAEDERQSEDLRTAERVRANSESRAGEAESEAAAALSWAQETEAASRQAAQVAAPSTADFQEFLRLLHDTNPTFTTVPDASLVELGEITCDYLDTFGNSEPTVARIVSVGVASGMTSREAAEVTSAAMVLLCPQHKLD